MTNDKARQVISKVVTSWIDERYLGEDGHLAKTSHVDNIDMDDLCDRMVDVVAGFVVPLSDENQYLHHELQRANAKLATYRAIMVRTQPLAIPDPTTPGELLEVAVPTESLARILDRLEAAEQLVEQLKNPPAL